MESPNVVDEDSDIEMLNGSNLFFKIPRRTRYSINHQKPDFRAKAFSFEFGFGGFEFLLVAPLQNHIETVRHKLLCKAVADAWSSLLPSEAAGKRSHTITATNHKSPCLIAALVASERRFGRTNRECEEQRFDHEPQERTQPNIVDKRAHSGM